MTPEEASDIIRNYSTPEEYAEANIKNSNAKMKYAERHYIYYQALQIVIQAGLDATKGGIMKPEEKAEKYAGQYICPLNNGKPVTPYEISIVKTVKRNFLAGYEAAMKEVEDSRRWLDTHTGDWDVEKYYPKEKS